MYIYIYLWGWGRERDEERGRERDEERERDEFCPQRDLLKSLPLALVNMTWKYVLCRCYQVKGEGNGNPLQYSCLENPRDRGAWWAAVYGVAQSWTQLKRLSSSSSIKWRQSHPGLGWALIQWVNAINYYILKRKGKEKKGRKGGKKREMWSKLF